MTQLRKATRQKAKIRLGLSSVSGGGKTYSSILIAKGLSTSMDKIALIDTENGSGDLYANLGDYNVITLEAPYTPERYIEAITACENAGMEVIIIDSITHEWEGTGGCEDIANAPKADGAERKVANWIVAKREHKAFMNVLLQSDMHIICCIRAREKTDFKIPTKPVSLGVHPIWEKTFMFEMTASVMMEDNGKSQIHTKVPEYLKEAFDTGKGYWGIETVQKIRSWLEEGTKPDPEIERIKSDALFACEKGVESLMKVWDSLTPEQKNNKEVAKHFGVCKASAKEYDRINSDSEDSPEWVTEIKGLFADALNLLTQEEVEYVESVINNKQFSNYNKTKTVLTSKLKENESTNKEA